MEDKFRKEVLRKHHVVIRQHLSPIQILPQLMKIDTVEKEANRILTLESKDKREQACDVLVDCLIDSGDPGWYKIFIDALNDEGFEIIARTIKGYKDVKDQEIYVKLISLFYPDLCAVDNSQLIPYLRKSGCINQHDEEAIHNAKGNYMANLLMLNIIPKKSEDWFAGLMYALKNTDNDNLVTTIVPKLKGVGPDQDQHIRKVTDLMHKEHEEYQRNAAVHATTSKVQQMQLTEDSDSAVYHDERMLPSGSSTDVKQRMHVRPNVKQGNYLHPPKTATLSLDLREDQSKLSNYSDLKEGPSAHHIELKEGQSAQHNELNEGQSALKEGQNSQHKLKATLKVDTKSGSHILKATLEVDSTSSSQMTCSTDNCSGCPSCLSSVSKQPSPDISFEKSYTSDVKGGNDLQGANDPPPNKKIKPDVLGSRLPPIGQEAENSRSDQAVARASAPSVAVMSDVHQAQMNNFNVPTGTKQFYKTAFDTEEVQQLDYNAASHQNTTVQNADRTSTSHEILQLRSYQIELASPAISGQNSLIVAPTGSGKTHVALSISKHHLKTCEVGETPKILFIVPTVTLVQQQEEQFRTYLSQWKIVKVFGDTTTDNNAPLSFLLPKYDIFVITPQILVDALGKKQIESLDCFSLIIFDECHHTMKSHPYNAIMSCYFQEKTMNRNTNLPQIVGLTASVGVGKATTVDSACDHILKLCANLDADIHTVQNEVNALKQFSNVPIEESHIVKGRREDPFHQIINNIMSEVEKIMDSAPEIANVTEVPDFRTILQPPRERGCDSYTQWISRLRKPVAKIFDQKTRRVFVACMNHLKTYNEALLLNADCRSKDALNHIKKTFGEFKEAVPYHDETDVRLDKNFREKESTLQKISQHPSNANPKLLKMKELLLKQYGETPDLRAIIFCKTRDMTIALENWIREDQELAKLNPSQLVGANVSSDKGGMTQQKQADVVKFFRSGKHKVILATTVAEEGLDIKKCNLVIRYEHVTNETARIQSKGRGRDEDSKYMLIADKDSSALSKDEINQAREELMYKAISALLKMPAEEIQKRKQNFQEREQAKRKTKEIQQLAQAAFQNEMLEEDYELRCLKCDAFACFSFDMCKVNDLRMVISQEFMDAIEIQNHPRPEKGPDYFKKVGKIYCITCHYDWGVQVVYESLKYPCIKISSFVLIDSQGKRETCRKWKDSPFDVRELKSEDQLKMSEMQ